MSGGVPPREGCRPRRTDRRRTRRRAVGADEMALRQLRLVHEAAVIATPVAKVRRRVVKPTRVLAGYQRRRSHASHSYRRVRATDEQ
jgi:hypothetical protein